MGTKPFLPTRWWEWTLTILILASFVAILWPPRVSMGPTFGPGIVAQGIRDLRLRTGRWPMAGEPIRVGQRFEDRVYAYALHRSGTDAATYRIVVDDRDELWRISISSGRLKRLARF